MNRKNYPIAMLSITAVALLLANYLVSAPAVAGMVIKDRDYLVSTARVQSGGDALYIVDNRTGQMAVFVYDPSARRLIPRDIRPVGDAFSGR